jgi:RNA binding exosome subunit
MKLCHNIIVRVFCHSHEDEKRIEATLRSLFSFDLEKEKIPLHRIKATAADGFTPIFILQIHLEKDKHIAKFLEQLNKNLTPENKNMLIRQDNRIDDDCNFYMRLDKPKLLEGIYWLTDEGNCFHFRFCVAAFPKKREVAKVVVRRMFS